MQETIVELTDNQLKELVASGQELVFVDIRTQAEYQREHLPHSVNVEVEALQRQDWQDKTLVFYCQLGSRTQQAKPSLEQVAAKKKYCLQQGLSQWKRCGLPTNLDKSAPIELMRQVQIIAGFLIVLGCLLTAFVSSFFILIPGFVGLGLLTAGLTGFCGMAKLLMKLPYNQPN